ncbi:hypothetical protein L2E82_01970 [Cichorium intybus]|uniref:Uncharacterized protein n=1 Tax=Cichorium intybus TaxID=13427 RepID=A0ACB9H0C7_CICIN|nr:hypothetical protein L2E82_01970 [Cichorium intybus]
MDYLPQLRANLTCRNSGELMIENYFDLPTLEYLWQLGIDVEYRMNAELDRDRNTINHGIQFKKRGGDMPD